MERDKALGILKALADGVDPVTGEQFAAGSPYQEPDTVRALYCAVQALENPTRTSERSAQKSPPENAGRPWSDEEEARLAAAFESGKAILDLAQEHKRSRIAIEARLVKLGKISAQQSTPLRYPIQGHSATASGVSNSAQIM